MPLWESYEPVPNPKEPTRDRRGRSALDPLQWHLGGHAGRGAARGGHAPDGARPRARGDRAADARLLELHARVGGPSAAVARPLPRPRPDPALRLHEVGAPDSAVVPPQGALGPQVAPAPRAARPPPADLSGRHRRGDPSRPGGRRPVDHHHGLLRRPYDLPHDAARVVPRLLDGAHRHAARCLVARSASAGGGSHRGRLLRGVHGGRARHPRTGVRLRRHCAHRAGTGRDLGLSGRPSPRQRGEGRLRPPPPLRRHARRGAGRASGPISTAFPVRIEV